MQISHSAPARLVAIGGLSGTGKSSLAAALSGSIGRAPGAVHLRSDIERKRLFDVHEFDRLPAEAYRPEATARTYQRLHDWLQPRLMLARASSSTPCI